MAILSSNPFNIRIMPRGALAASFQLVSTVGGADLPFTLGHAFKKGDVPAGSVVGGNLAGLQVVGKNAWPDGSLKFAIISGRATLTPGVAKTVTLAIGGAAAGASLTLDALRATGVTAAVGAGGFGSASWSDADWNAPFKTWVSGSQMSSWIYRKPVGSDAHLVAWLEVRLYAGGAVEILPWIENGYLNVVGPTNKDATYTFAMGGTQRFSAAFNLPNHCRTPLVSGTTLSHWLGASPAIIPTHDKAYLQASRLVPAYRATVPSNAPVYADLVSTYTPLQKGNHSPSMGMGGYHPAIGLLPEWDVLYLTTNDTRAYAGVVINGYSAGRYGTHYRDETTQRPLRFSSYPNLVVHGADASGIANTGASTKETYTPLPTGIAPPDWDTPHHPSLGFTAYLLTGRFYFMEESQFVATITFLKTTDRTRMFGLGVIKSQSANTTRGAAWALRSLAQAACITPDDDTALRGEFVGCMANHAEFYHSTYVAQPNNPHGIVSPYSSYTPGSGVYSEAAWMQDFFTAATGYAIDLGIGMPATSISKLSAFFAWKAQSIIGRLGGTAPTDFLYCDAAVYTLAVAPSDTPNFDTGTGPWYASWGDIYKATKGAANPGVGGALRGPSYPDPTSYWGNLQPAIAYAVQHNVPGALAAYTRMTSAPNWSAIVDGWNNYPVWGVAPRLQ